jgi:hypothetical protein
MMAILRKSKCVFDSRPLTQLGFAGRLEHDVLPFWKEASDRFAVVHLAPGSPNLSSLGLLQTLSDGRVEGYELLASGLRRNDGKEMSNARTKLADVDKLIEKSGTADGLERNRFIGR